jgi:hypothetical protein
MIYVSDVDTNLNQTKVRRDYDKAFQAFLKASPETHFLHEEALPLDDHASKFLADSPSLWRRLRSKLWTSPPA